MCTIVEPHSSKAFWRETEVKFNKTKIIENYPKINKNYSIYKLQFIITIIKNNFEQYTIIFYNFGSAKYLVIMV